MNDPIQAMMTIISERQQRQTSSKIASPRILILTAAFGEGHNSAARNLALSLKDAGATIEVCDPCKAAAPQSTRLLEWGYQLVTNHFPTVWKGIFHLADKADFNSTGLPLMSKPERFLSNLIEDFKPDAIVSTYPIYPYFVARNFLETGRVIPVFTVVTDSIVINASWLGAPSDYWVVTDAATRQRMSASGVEIAKIEDTGFPVHPDFGRQQPIGAGIALENFRVLYFPTARIMSFGIHCRALLDASPLVRLTIVMGKHQKLLGARALRIRKEFPGRVRLVGWTRRIPKLLNNHHIVVGKAGGATVHEAIAAQCPMLIHHLVPGQEEGNLRLLEAIGCGKLCDHPKSLADTVSSLLSNDADGWRTMKRNVAKHDRRLGSQTAARFILAKIAGL